MKSPSLVLLGEGAGHFTYLHLMISSGKTVGNLIHDAHIAALIQEHGIDEFWTTDKDFSRFSGINIRNPFEK